MQNVLFNITLQQLPAQIIILIATFAIQLVRIFNGVDFNDEMQYYGEIISLLESGSLFSSDWFIQQLVYLLSYPLLKLTYYFFGYEGIIVTGRALFAIFLMGCFGYVRRALTRGNIEPIVASTTAFSVTFAIPIYNIYAISYNTVALGLTALCIAEFIAWRIDRKNPRVLLLGILCALISVVYPPFVISIVSLIIYRLSIERDHASIRVFLLSTLVAGVLLACTTIYFSSLNDLLKSIEFTSSVGAGGNALFNGGWRPLAWLWFFVILFFLAGNRGVFFFRSPLNKYFGIVAIIIFLIALIFSGHQAVYGQVSISAATLVICGIAATWWHPDKGVIVTRAWLVAFYLLIATTYGIASSNGFMQTHGASMLAAPFFAALAAMKNGGEDHNTARSFRRVFARSLSVGIFAVFVIIFLARPYQDGYLWNQVARSTVDAKAFRFVRMTEEKAAAISHIRQVLSDIPEGKKIMVIGAHPWIYFATNTQPDTDMIFMHSITLPKAFELLASKLASRRPEYIVLAGQVSFPVLEAFRHIINAGAYSCGKNPTPPLLSHARSTIKTYYDVLPFVTICRIGRAT